MQCTTVLVCQQVWIPSRIISAPEFISINYIKNKYSGAIMWKVCITKFLWQWNNFAVLHCYIVSALMREFKAQKLLGCIHSRLDGVNTVEPSFCFHTVPYSSNLFHIFGKHRVFSVSKVADAPLLFPFTFLLYIFFLVKCMWAVPDPSRVILSHKKCSFNSDMEQVAILTLCGKYMSQGLNLLHRVLAEGPQGGWSSTTFVKAQPVLGFGTGSGSQIHVAVN